MARTTKPIDKEAKKQRVVLDMSPNAVQRLDDLKQTIEADSRAAVIRNALQLYEWFIQEVSQNKDVFVGHLDDEPPNTLTKIKIFAG